MRPIVSLLCIICIAAAVSAIVCGVGDYIQKNRNAARNLAYYEKTYLRMQGSSTGFGTYELLSFDAGKRWYAVERGEENAVIIRGPAEEIFPGLIAHLDAYDRLFEYVKKNGPLTLTGERAKADRALLEEAGFTVNDTATTQQ
jgi:hypothetical protein